MKQLTLKDLEIRLQAIYSRIPNLPLDIRSLIVDYGPYIVLFSGLLSLFSSGILKLYTLGLATMLSGGLIGINIFLRMIFNLVAGIILISDFKHLKSRQIRGWHTLFYLNLLLLFLSLINFDLFSLIMPIVGFYFLFQIKTYYH